MLDIFKTLFTLFRRRPVNIDSLVFKLHYRVTVPLLSLFCVIAAVNQYVTTSPIICNAQFESTELLNAFCSSAPLFKTSPSRIEHPGISRAADKKETKYLHNYTWVWFCLFFQAILFYIPHWLWKTWEEGKLRALKNIISGRAFVEQESSVEIETVSQYLTATLRKHNVWAHRYLVCELLNFINVLGQMFLMNRFLGGAFWTYGTDVLNFLETDAQERTDPISKVFPSIAKCEFRKNSPSGSIQIHDSFCVLPLNSLYEKIYIFLWFWFLLLLIITAMFLILLTATMALVKLRILVLRVMYWQILSHRRNVENAVFRGFFGDWLLIYLLGKNVDSTSFSNVVNKLGHKVSDDGEEKERSEMI